MPTNEKRRQKALARKSARRKQRKHGLSLQAMPAGRRGQLKAAAKWPLHESLLSRGWDQPGELVQALVARSSPEGEIGVGFFLLDLGCLGVKDAFGHLVSPAEYRELRRGIVDQFGLKRADINLVAKIIREAVAYADRLGFHPHQDFRDAAPLLQDADPDACRTEIPLGMEGKPFFVPGPYDNVPKILAQLERAVGPGGYQHVLDVSPDLELLADLPSIEDYDLDFEDEPVEGSFDTPDDGQEPEESRRRRGLSLGRWFGRKREKSDQHSFTRLLARSGALKRSLIEFGLGPRFAKELEEARHAYFRGRPATDEGEFGNFVDYFILQRPLSDGKTPVERFVAARPGLSEAERAMLLGWQDVVEGVFEVQRREKGGLVVLSLIDELIYRVHSNMGAVALAPMDPGCFLIARLVPLGGEWMLSGASSVLQSSERQKAMEIANNLVSKHPELVFRNPQKLELAWELQRKERQRFIEFFGSNLVTVPGRQLEERLEAFHHFRDYELRDEEGKTIAERAVEAYGTAPAPIRWEMPDDLTKRETVGLIYDEIEGLNFFPDFGLVEEAFATPSLVRAEPHRDAVREYLESPNISPLPLRRLVERNPANANAVFRELLSRPDFDWTRESEALLRQYKPRYFDVQPLPGITPVTRHALPDSLRS